VKPNAAPDLDPAKFTVVPHVAVLDEFKMTNDDGSFVADINEKFIDRLVARMREREATTGDLCPGVIGHTKDGEREIEGPPVTAYLRNWVKDDFFDTGRKAAFADIWVFNEDVDTVRKFPRRSAEVWPDRYEIDPLSFLGATTPARDLGLMRLSRGGSFTYSLPGELKMPEETGAAKGTDAKLDQILAKLTEVLTAFTSGGGAPKPAEGATGAPGGGHDELSDEEFMKLLEGAGGAKGEHEEEEEEEPEPEDKSRKAAKPPVQNDATAGGNNTYVADLAHTKAKLARIEVQRTFEKARFEKHADVDPNDEALISDLIAMPEDVRNRSIDRLVKNARKLPTAPSLHLDSAIANGTDGTKKRLTATDQPAVIKLARAKGITYESAAEELGFSVR